MGKDGWVRRASRTNDGELGRGRGRRDGDEGSGGGGGTRWWLGGRVEVELGRVRVSLGQIWWAFGQFCHVGLNVHFVWFFVRLTEN
jgi:hypothetical protein